MSKKQDQQSYTMVCVRCRNERPDDSVLGNKKARSTVKHLFCTKCKAITAHKEKRFFQKEEKHLECNEMFGNNIDNMDNIRIKCLLPNGLFFIFKSVGEAASWIVMNEISQENRDHIMNLIRNVLRHKATLLYGLNFEYVYIGLYNRYCSDPIGYCKLKGCYLSEQDVQCKECLIKKCKNYIVKESEDTCIEEIPVEIQEGVHMDIT